MEKKNMVLLTVIAVATLLVAVVGATFAYFTATVKDERGDGDAGTTSVTAGSIANTTVVSNVSQAAGKFEKTGVYPGHIEVAGLSVKATHNKNETTNTKINIVYDVTSNTFANDDIEINVYKKAGDELELNNYFNCKHTSNQQDGNVVQFSETCDKQPDSLVDELSAEKLTKEPVKLEQGKKEDIVLATDTITTNNMEEKTVNYYVVVQFKDNGDQNVSMNATLDGKITVEVA